MRFKMIAVAASILCLTILTAGAADVTGTWVAEGAGGPGGQQMKFTFNLIADGSTLTGTLIGPGDNENEIIEGKIEGDEVSFAVKVDRGGNEIKINYRGAVSGNELKMTFEFEGSMEGPNAKPMEIIARRQ